MTVSIRPVQGPPEASPVRDVPGGDPYTAMTSRFGRLARAFGRRFFAGFRFEPGVPQALQALEREGAVVYVMRYSSRLDYFLFNWLFLTSGIRLSAAANGIHFSYYRPLGQALRLPARRLLERLRLGREGMRRRQIACMRQVLREGGSLFLFLRTAKIRQVLGTRRGKIASGRSELDFLRELVDTCFEEPIPVRLVPLALFWSRGLRPGHRYLDLFYGAPGRPSDTAKVLSFLWNYRSLAVRVGTAIDLRAFVDQRRDAGRETVVKQVRRSLMIFLRREEKPVAGTPLRLVERLEDAVIADSEVQRAIREAVGERGSRARAEGRARRHLREIAARQSGAVLAILDVIVGWMFRRLFARVEVHGLERVVEAAKLHPLVAVPSHRSHFDYLILSWLFYERHLVPPHVAAGINLAFWPLGPIFRRAGAFFLRRSFEGDPLYATVFRTYVRVLIKDGATQEFFIEGTRSRTGKTLTPRLGMLGMVLEAFCRGARRDLYLVPVGFTYELLVEESSISQERHGAAKRKETLWSLVRARRLLQRRFGSVVVRFGEPISLAEALGPALLSRDPADPEAQILRRRETERLGNELCRRINGLISAGRSAVSSVALLADPREGLREQDLRARVEETVALLRLLHVPFTEALEGVLEEGRPEAVTDLLVQGRLVERVEGRTGVFVHFAPGQRDRLDYYRSGVSPALAWAAALALGLREARTREEVLGEADSWIELLRLEHFPPGDGRARQELLERVLEHFRERGWVREHPGAGLSVSPEGWPWMRFWGAQIEPMLEAYRAALRTVGLMGGDGQRRSMVEAGVEVFEEMLTLGEARFPEALSPVTLGNALDLLRREKILSCRGSPGRADACLEPGPAWPRLPELEARLAGALRSR